MTKDKRTLEERIKEWKTFAQSDCDFVLFNEDVNEVLELYKKQETQTKRSEKEILKDFEKFGYVVKVNSVNELILTFNENYTIIVKKWFRTYRAIYVSLYEEISSIGMKEHKLLHELFECWGWI